MSLMHGSSSFRTVAVAITFCCASRVASTQDPEPVERERVLVPAALEAFVDGYMASYLDEANIVGATVAFVENDELVLTKGYGYADLSEHTRVDPATTLFRIGSVSKLFVWTAVMQLVEQGKLESGMPVLEKPFEEHQLVERIRSLLDDRAT